MTVSAAIQQKIEENRRSSETTLNLHGRVFTWKDEVAGRDLNHNTLHSVPESIRELTHLESLCSVMFQS